MKKKLLFTAYNLGLGGIETALINLLKRLDYNKYDVTLILEKKEGIFLNDVPKNVKILEYKISNSKFILFRKIYNRLKLIKWEKKIKNKYDFSCSFTTYSIPGAHLALCASKNNTLWMHGNYYVLYERNEMEMRKFLDSVFINKFNRIVFVSEENKKDVCKHYQEIKDRAVVCNNFINGEEILTKSLEKCDYKKDKITFVNVGRHEERQKRLSRIIEACKMLKNEKYDFKVLLIGDGPDSENYKKLIKEKELEDTIIMLGRKKNPFPYYKLADAVILSSDYEGYPVVFLEAMVLNKPIISTKVSDYEDLDKKYGLFCDLNTDGVYNNLKEFLDKGFKVKSKFDYQKYNDIVLKKIESYINNESK